MRSFNEVFAMHQTRLRGDGGAWREGVHAAGDQDDRQAFLRLQVGQRMGSGDGARMTILFNWVEERGVVRRITW